MVLNGRDGPNPWSLRKIGVYQQFCLHSRRSWWIIIGQLQAVRMQLSNFLDCANGSQRLKNEHPMLLHLVILSTGVDNWPEYLEYLQDQLFELVSESSSSFTADCLRMKKHASLGSGQHANTITLFLFPTAKISNCCNRSFSKQHLPSTHASTSFKGARITTMN